MRHARRGMSVAATLLWAGVLAGQTAPTAQLVSTRVSDGVAYTTAGEVVRPANYREWVFLSSGLGMTYGPEQPAAGRPPLFDNVFVNPQSYRAFVATGRWPEGTMFVLELRRAVSGASINNGGYTQTAIAAIEAAVKDTERFSDTGGWKYFGFGTPAKELASAAPQPPSATCYGCHSRHTAVENTFVQFYPTLFDVAKARGTVKPSYDPARKVE
jgi:hypothetical protein